MMAQATRAVLFAKATAATSLGFRLSKDINQGSVLACFEHSSTVWALLTSRRRRKLSPRLLIPPRRALPPVEFCRCTSPSQAANSLPLQHMLGSATLAAIAVANDGPTPR